MNAEEFKISVIPAKDKMFRLAKRMLFDIEEAEDAVQDVLIKLWEMRDKMSSTRNPVSYAMMSVKNYCIDKIRTRRQMYELNEDIVETKICQPDTQAELSETKKIVETIINSLPEQQKIIMHLRDIEQCEYEEIEQITGYDRNYIKVNLSRARKKVREQLLTKYKYRYERN
jgi:RNA polymerase sigma factor (sigma-70 family)